MLETTLSIFIGSSGVQGSARLRFLAQITLLTIVALIAKPFFAEADYTGTVLYPLSTYSGGLSIIDAGIPVGGQVPGDGYGSATGNNFHALLWSGPDGDAVDLNPSGFVYSQANSISGTQQVGSAQENSGGNVHAMLWSGTAASAVDLNPTGFDGSGASYTNGSQQVGYATGSATSGNAHAILWSGTAASAVDLNPISGFITSYASSVSGGQQVGFGYGSVTSDNFHALLWTGTAASAVDLNPTGFLDSRAIGNHGTQQVGSGDVAPNGYPQHALMWSGTASSFVDLTPSGSGFESGFAAALGTNGTQQVGWGEGSATNYGRHALMWSGTAASMVDLHTLLPESDNLDDSIAWTIDSDGNIFGTADGTYNDVSGTFAVEWSPVPEPASIVYAALSGAMLFPMMRRNLIRWRDRCIVVRSPGGF